MIILGTNSIKDTGYDVANSCMFNVGDDAKLTRTAPNSSATHDDKFTFSFWIKRAVLGARQQIYSTFDGGGAPYQEFQFYFKDTDELRIQTYNSSNQMELIPNRRFRDVSAWYHFVFAYDSSQGTASNRAKLYVNGTQETSFSTETYPAQNTDGEFAIQNHIQAIGNNTANNRDSGLYLTEVVGVDGQALAPTEFGEFDEDSPTIWKPKDVSGINVGTLGFYLDFEDSSNLGNDVSSVGDFTATNLAATDQMIDTCTKNFPTLNSLEGATSAVGTKTYSQGNLQVLTPSSGNGNTLSSIGVSSGKWYSEFYIKANSGIERSLVGVSGDVGATLLAENNMGSLSGALDVGYMGNDGDKFVSGSESSYGGSAFSVGDVIGVALDLDNRTVNFAQNNSFKGTISIASTGTWHMGCGDVSGGASATIVVNYGQNSSFAGSITAANNTDEHGEGLFKYSPPSGFITLNSTNLGEYGG